MSRYIGRGLGRLREAVSRVKSPETLLPAYCTVCGQVKVATFSDVMTAYDARALLVSLLSFRV